MGGVEVDPILVDIDVKPGSGPYVISPGSKGVGPVAILHTDQFDPGQSVDVGTVRFGDSEDVRSP